MTVKLRLFAAARQLAGSSIVAIECPPSATVADLRQALIQQYEPLAGLVPLTRFAVGSEYVTDDYVLQPDQELAFIAPVSGG